MVYFSDIFGIDEHILEEYGAFNISLINDLPLFIDPFLLYASNKKEYRQQHFNILKYLSFLKTKSEQQKETKSKWDYQKILELQCYKRILSSRN